MYSNVPVDFVDRGEEVFDLPAMERLVPEKGRRVVFDHLYDEAALESLVKEQVKHCLGDAECMLEDP